MVEIHMNARKPPVHNKTNTNMQAFSMPILICPVGLYTSTRPVTLAAATFAGQPLQKKGAHLEAADILLIIVTLAIIKEIMPVAKPREIVKSFKQPFPDFIVEVRANDLIENIIRIHVHKIIMAVFIVSRAPMASALLP